MCSYQVTWPSGKNGGDILNPVFELYSDALWGQFAVMAVAFAILLLMLFADLRERTAVGLKRSRYLGFVGCAVLFLGVISTALLNYLNDTPVDKVPKAC